MFARTALSLCRRGWSLGSIQSTSGQEATSSICESVRKATAEEPSRRGKAERTVAGSFEAGAEAGGAFVVGQERADLHPAGGVGVRCGGGAFRGVEADGLVFLLPFAGPEDVGIGGDGVHFGGSGPDDIGVFGDVAADLGGGFEPGALGFGDGGRELDEVGGARLGGGGPEGGSGLLRELRLDGGELGLRGWCVGVDCAPLEEDGFCGVGGERGEREEN